MAGLISELAAVWRAPAHALQPFWEDLARLDPTATGVAQAKQEPGDVCARRDRHGEPGLACIGASTRSMHDDRLSAFTLLR